MKLENVSTVTVMSIAVTVKKDFFKYGNFVNLSIRNKD